MHYTATAYKPMSMISLHGHNKQITAIDEISFVPVSSHVTNVTYRANITLNGILCLFTPFIRSGLNELTETAKNGMLKRSQELFGKVA